MNRLKRWARSDLAAAAFFAAIAAGLLLWCWGCFRLTEWVMTRFPLPHL